MRENGLPGWLWWSTLHYYDEIGLPAPSGRSSGGHRLYAPQDMQRLYRIGLLRDLGLRLGEIAAALDEPEWDLLAVLCRHIGCAGEPSRTWGRFSF